MVVFKFKAIPFARITNSFLCWRWRSDASCQVIDLVLSDFLNLRIQMLVLLGGCALMVVKSSSFHTRSVSVTSDLSTIPAACAVCSSCRGSCFPLRTRWNDDWFCILRLMFLRSVEIIWFGLI